MLIVDWISDVCTSDLERFSGRRLWPDDHHADLLYSHLHSALSDRPPELLRAADSFFQSRAASVSFEKCLMLFKGGTGRANDAPVRRSRPRSAVGMQHRGGRLWRDPPCRICRRPALHPATGGGRRWRGATLFLRDEPPARLPHPRNRAAASPRRPHPPWTTGTAPARRSRQEGEIPHPAPFPDPRHLVDRESEVV